LAQKISIFVTYQIKKTRINSYIKEINKWVVIHVPVADAAQAPNQVAAKATAAAAQEAVTD